MGRWTINRMMGAGRAGRLLAALSLVLAAGAGAALAQDAAAPPASAKDFDYAAVPLRVAVWTDRADGEVYRKGEPMTVGFETNEDAYAVVYRIDAEGEVTILWPRTRMDDGFVFGGHEYLLPVQGGRQLRTAAAEGEGFVEAVVSRYPFDLRALEVDFHHERGHDRRGFRVAGDPFLAMNEVNYAITGLEDPGDYVVTNYASYYVHREVDHPRYLCGQCHFDDGTDYDPYRDECSLNITVDYRWGNAWWDRYGYYPVYYYPSYVYVDPWTWRPWVNFWYDPWWRVPGVSVCVWPYSWYSWHDYRYYRGDCWTYASGHPRYRPLNPRPGEGARTKVREYGALAPLASAGKDGGRTRSLDARTAYRGEPRTQRSRPAIDDNVRTRGTAGLRIREGGSVRGGPAGAGARVRHSAAGDDRRSGLVPVAGPARGGGGVRRDARGGTAGTKERVDAPRGGRDGRVRGEADGRTIRPVEPRQRGSRIWNTGRSGGSAGSRRGEQVRPGGRSGGGDSRRDGTVRSRGGDSGRDAGSSRDTRTRSGSRGSSRDSKAGSGGSRSGGRDTKARSGGSRSGGRDTKARSGGSRSGGGSRDSSVRSRSSGSRGGGSAHSSGGSRGGGRSSGSSRGGSRARGGGR